MRAKNEPSRPAGGLYRIHTRTRVLPSSSAGSKETTPSFGTVAPGTDCPSLGAVVTLVGGLKLFVNGKGKLRAHLSDSRAIWNLPVVSHAIKAAWRERGIACVQAWLSTTRLHVRLGLARPEAAAGIEDCYIMLNGAFPCES